MNTSTDLISILQHILQVSSTHSVYIFCSSSMNVVIVKFQLHGPAFRCVKFFILIVIQFSTLTKCDGKLSALLILAFGWLYTSLQLIYLIQRRRTTKPTVDTSFQRIPINSHSQGCKEHNNAMRCGYGICGQVEIKETLLLGLDNI